MPTGHTAAILELLVVINPNSCGSNPLRPGIVDMMYPLACRQTIRQDVHHLQCQPNENQAIWVQGLWITQTKLKKKFPALLH